MIGGAVLAAALASAPSTPAAASPAPAPAAATPAPPQVTRVKPQARPVGTVVFSHRVHMEAKHNLTCEKCHDLKIDGNRSRSTPEALCRKCHEKDARIGEFRKSLEAARRPVRQGSPPPLHQAHTTFPCLSCHSNQLQSEKVGDFPLPPRDNTSPTCVHCHGKQVRFSHAEHLDPSGKVAERVALDAPVNGETTAGAPCSLCHRATAEGLLYSNPGHTECWACHDITLLGLSEGCNLCHLEQVRGEKTFHIEDASLRHKQHRSLPCSDCHASILTARTLDELKLARDESSQVSCIRCHAQ